MTGVVVVAALVAVVDQRHQPDADGEGQAHTEQQRQPTVHAHLDLGELTPDIDDEADDDAKRDEGGDHQESRAA